MWFEISKKVKLANLPKSLLKYRWHENNTSLLKKDIQTEKANKIRKNILEFTLSYEISEDENLLFGLIYNPELINLSNLISFENLLVKILQKNAKVGYYNERVLRNLFFFFWTKVCYNTKNISRKKIFQIYLSSSLFHYISLISLISIKRINKFFYDKIIRK